MQRLNYLVLIFAVIFILFGCMEKNNDSSENIPADQIAATVNGMIISKDEVAQFRELKGNPQVDDNKLTEEIIATELLRQQAVKEGIADREEVRFQLKLLESETLARLLMREKFGSTTFTEEELKALSEVLLRVAELFLQLVAQHVAGDADDLHPTALRPSRAVKVTCPAR